MQTLPGRGWVPYRAPTVWRRRFLTHANRVDANVKFKSKEVRL
jgi:hypothetical protein